jgi:hypothetical protein
MKESAFFWLALLSLAVLAAQNVMAGSAVAIGPHNQLVYSYGHPKEIDKERALELARQRYGPDVKILAASDVAGYGAIAGARHPNGNRVIGAALGHASPMEAEHRAIELCLKAGGLDPKVRWRFRG